MGTVTRIEQSLAGFAGGAGRLFRGRPQSVSGEIELAGIDVLGEPRTGLFPQEPSTAPPRPKDDIFDIGAILRLRTFLYLIAATALLLFQIHNTLSIKELARQNERLREQLRISTSIRTAQELKASELQSIHNISGYAQGLGLASSAVPPVDLEP
ncbi:MAG: hypothetical protein HGB02_03020 [Chlorobiaceae bacterium]|nr:hypothetical protein [Chlorobiaceae bacterium]